MEPELVVRAQSGDQAAFARLAVEAGPRFHAVAHRILRDIAMAQDATQQALLDTWQDLPHLRDPARFEAWSFRILVRVCYAYARRSRRLPAIELKPTELRSPVDDYAVVNDRDQLERAFGRLPVEQRAVVVLHHYLGLQVKEVADAVGASPETVRTRLKRGMEAMRAALEADARSTLLDPEITREVVA